MESCIAVTPEIDDLEKAVQELSSKIKGKAALNRSSVGIAYCDADVDVARFGELMHAELGIDIAGLTTTATLERNSGYNDMGIVLCVLTADDVYFSIGCTGELGKESYPDSIRKAFRQARENIREESKLILTLAPYVSDITSENYVEILDEVSNGTPVFGGVATDHYDLQYQKTFLNGVSFSRGLIFILFAGNIKPVFAMQHHFGAHVVKKGIITQSSGNQIQKVGKQTFVEFVSSIVPVPDEEVVVYHFQSTPFIVELPGYEKDEQPVIRELCTIDHKTGAGGFLTKMPEGSTIYMNVFQREDLKESCRGALTDIIGKITESRDYQYSLVFISTCNARHLIMGDAKNLESEILSEKFSALPPGLNAIGFYGFGEICPTGTRADGTAKNRFHNVSFAACAI
ncbi:MAG: FIST C-terminal domain-containing protein [Treponema sp.]|nr:FIST C-terminal domain-containing protein [Treponema sp.]